MSLVRAEPWMAQDKVMTINDPVDGPLLYCHPDQLTRMQELEERVGGEVHFRRVLYRALRELPSEAMDEAIDFEGLLLP